jgi:hypothetical protein
MKFSLTKSTLGVSLETMLKMSSMGITKYQLLWVAALPVVPTAYHERRGYIVEGTGSIFCRKLFGKAAIGETIDNESLGMLTTLRNLRCYRL